MTQAYPVWWLSFRWHKLATAKDNKQSRSPTIRFLNHSFLAALRSAFPEGQTFIFDKYLYYDQVNYQMENIYSIRFSVNYSHNYWHYYSVTTIFSTIMFINKTIIIIIIAIISHYYFDLRHAVTAPSFTRREEKLRFAQDLGKATATWPDHITPWNSARVGLPSCQTAVFRISLRKMGKHTLPW